MALTLTVSTDEDARTDRDDGSIGSALTVGSERSSGPSPCGKRSIGKHEVIALPSNPPHPRHGEWRLVMKKLILMAMMLVTMGVGAAWAHPTVTNQAGQTLWGPAYNDDAAGAGG